MLSERKSTPDYYFNGDLENVITPVNTRRLIQLLRDLKYEDSEIKFLQQGFTQGFDISYTGPQIRKSTSQNIPFTVGDKVDMWNKLMKEVKLGRVAGPFDEVPFENFIQSPIGLMPKVGSDQTRLIFHLSYDFKDGLKSVNYHTPKERCSVRYKDLDYAVGTFLDLFQELMVESQQPTSECTTKSAFYSRPSLQRLWKSRFTNHRLHQPIFSGKSDLKLAFRILGLSRSSWPWLVMTAQDPTTLQSKFFVDKCLPFSSSISCSHFQHFSDALCHLIQWRLKLNNKRRITNYLDDFLFVAKTLERCNFMIQEFLKLCTDIRVPVSMEKTEWGSILTMFLGILLDGRNLILAIPEDKRLHAVNLLQEIRDKRKVTVKQLQQLCGFLNFLSKAIFPG